jgi:hypothetical protein
LSTIKICAWGLHDGISTLESHNPLGLSAKIDLKERLKKCAKLSHVFVEESRFTTVLEASVGQLHFLPSHVHLLLPWQSLSAHSLCCALGATAAHRPSNLG